MILKGETCPPTKDDPRKYLDPRTLAKVRSLELKARLIVVGGYSERYGKLALPDIDG